MSWLVLLSACWVRAELILGHGIVLKSAITIAVGLLGTAALTLVALRAGSERVPAPSTALRLAGVTLLVLVLAKSAAWWRATRGL
jgi:hypothetical protein